MELVRCPKYRAVVWAFGLAKPGPNPAASLIPAACAMSPLGSRSGASLLRHWLLLQRVRVVVWA